MVLNNIEKLLIKTTEKTKDELKREILSIVEYFERKKCKCYVKEVQGKNYLAISNGENVCYLNPYKNYDMSNYDIVIFRYLFDLSGIEAFRTKTVYLILEDETVNDVIDSIEKKINEENYFSWVVNNYKGREKVENIELEKYKKLLEGDGYKTKVIEMDLLDRAKEYLFFSKIKEDLLEPNVTFLLWIDKNNNIEVSSLIYINCELNVGSIYSSEKIEYFSLDLIRELFI